MPRVKRRAGGQPGNQNARKHGFYSKILSPAQTGNLLSANKVKGLDQEIAVLRVKIGSILANDPNNVPLLVTAMSSLAKLLKANQKLDKYELQDLSELARNAAQQSSPLFELRQK